MSEPSQTTNQEAYKMTNKLRLIITGVALIGWGVINTLLNRAAPIISGNLAGKQFENSVSGYVSGQTASFFNGAGLPSIILLGILAWIWWTPLKSFYKELISALLLCFIIASPAFAYYDKSDYSEDYFILPNESAFFVPDVGANKDTQAKFGSQDYYEANKIAAKRFHMPHQILSNSGVFSNFVVPSGRLIIVDRTPYHREWTASAQRGTSKNDQSFPCQSSEGLNVTVEIAVAASVTEDNSAKFLYYFGVNPPQGDRNDPKVIFTSVYYGRNLAQVMDTVGRGIVQSVVCEQIGQRPLDQANAQATAIIKATREQSSKFLADRGITVDYMGWAGTFTFDDTVQTAINNKYIADKVRDSIPVLQAQADINVKEGLGKGLASKGLPQSLIAIPEHLLDFASFFSGSKSIPSK